MRFEGEYNTVECENCGRTISQLDDHGGEDTPRCSGCWARDMQEHVKKLCFLCKKPLGDEEYSYEIDDCDRLAHTKCVEKLSESNQEEWSDDFSC